MQNFGRFYTTSDFDREYLRNGSRYPKSESYVIENNSSRVLRKKSGELWSTNYWDLDVSLDPLKWTFSGDYISAFRGCCALKFLHPLEIDQGLLARTPTGTGVPPKKFNCKNLKFGWKFSMCTPITSGLVGILLWNLFLSTCRRAGVITCVQFSEGPPPKIWEGQKNVQISARFLTTFEFDREYLRNGSTHQKSKT